MIKAFLHLYDTTAGYTCVIHKVKTRKPSYWTSGFITRFGTIHGWSSHFYKSEVNKRCKRWTSIILGEFTDGVETQYCEKIVTLGDRSDHF